MKLFGFFTEDSDETFAKPFQHYRSIRNRIPKESVLSYLQSLPIHAVSPGIAKDFLTGEFLPIMGLYQDGDFRFPVEFVHYYEKYDIGIPVEYEEYLAKEKGLST